MRASANVVLTSAAVVLSSCATDNLHSTMVQDSAMREMIACFATQAHALDDHASDALSIAVAVRGACYAELKAAKSASDPAWTTYDEQKRLFDALDRASLTWAEEVVLKERAAR